MDLLDFRVAVGPAKGPPDALVVRFHRDLDREIGQRAGHALVKLARRSFKQLEHDRLLVPGDGIQEPVGVGVAGLPDVSQDKHGALAEFTNLADIRGQVFRFAVSRPLPPVEYREKRRRPRRR